MGSSDNLSGLTARAMRYTQIGAEGTDNQNFRFALRDELYVMPLGADDSSYADEGSYFVAGSALVSGAGAGTAQPGTGLATIAAPTTFTDTSPFILIQNGNPVSSNIRITIKYIKLICTAAGTAGTSLRFASKVDMVNPLRYTSGGSVLLPINVNGDDVTVSQAKIYAGALVATASATGARGPYGNILIKATIPAAADQYLIKFGGVDVPARALATNTVDVHPPTVIGPQEWFAGHIWLPAQSAASSYEVEIGYIER